MSSEIPAEVTPIGGPNNVRVVPAQIARQRSLGASIAVSSHGFGREPVSSARRGETKLAQALPDLIAHKNEPVVPTMPDVFQSRRP